MDSRITPSISSFVIRFVMEAAPAEGGTQPAYRGAIRHIQSDEEMNFNTWEDAVEFIRRYVPLDHDPGIFPSTGSGPGGA
ncbi:MAG: hypothetical protein AB1846_18475 [Chloroflexota bacterium]